MANWVWMPEHSVFNDATDIFVGQPGDYCLASYKTVEGFIYSGVPGIKFPKLSFEAYPLFCVPAKYALTTALFFLEGNIDKMANWLLISANDIQAKLDTQTNAIVSRVSTGGGGTGGFTDADRFILGSISTIVGQLQNKLNSIESNVFAKQNQIITKIDNMTTNMILDHDEIYESISAGLGITEEGLLGGIGDLLSAGWEWVNGLIDEFANQIGEVLSWSDGVLVKIETAFLNRLTDLTTVMNGAMTFISNEIFAAFDVIAEKILSPLSLLGDITDFLAIDFMDWLADTFDFDIDEAEGFTKQLITMINSVLQETTQP